MAVEQKGIRLAVDIGGTFTDLVLDCAGRQYSAKTLTTEHAPEEGVLRGIAVVTAEAGVQLGGVGLLIHGTTLATNAIISRRGAKTALIVTEGHRDAVEMAYENRFEQYDVNVDRPLPLTPRHLRWPVRERLLPSGEVLLALDEDTVRALFPLIRYHQIESIAVGLLHGFANPQHERRVEEMLRDEFPTLSISLASEVCPEIREYERQSTTCANAYVQPLMARYLRKLDDGLRAGGLRGPFFLMGSSGGVMDLEASIRFPCRLIESGPAGGAVLAARIARSHGVRDALSFDMGGTTAKLCLIDDYTPLTSRSFEAARAYRFKRGSGLPIRIPVIEMVEIGAGGGSIASVDPMGRVQVGPASAGSDPGPACYGRGGTSPTVTDSDLLLGRLTEAGFAQGEFSLDGAASQRAVAEGLANEMGVTVAEAATAIAEIIEENMASAARVHAVEWGKDVAARTMVAFGGAAPLHAARLAEKLGIDRIIIPKAAGVGSAIGFLLAPIAYEVVRSRHMRISEFDADLVSRLMTEMGEEARAIVSRAGLDVTTAQETRLGYMRYCGQGHEIPVPIPDRVLVADDQETLRQAFVEVYHALFGRSIPGLDVEVLSWTLALSGPEQRLDEVVAQPRSTGTPSAERLVFDPVKQETLQSSVYARADLVPGAVVCGPAVIVEAQTTTIVPSSFTASIDSMGGIVLVRERV